MRHIVPFLLAATVAAGCNPGSTKTPPASHPEVGPSASRPIMDIRGDLVFGGKDGTGRDRIAWDVRPVARTVSVPGSRLAGVIVPSFDKGTEVRIYDAERRLARSTMLTKEARVGDMWLDDDGMAVVTLGMDLGDWMNPDRGSPWLPRPPKPSKTTFTIWPPDSGLTTMEFAGVANGVGVMGARRWVVVMAEGERCSLHLMRGDKEAWSRPLPDSAVGYDMTLGLDPQWPIEIWTAPHTTSLYFDVQGNQKREGRTSP